MNTLESICVKIINPGYLSIAANSLLFLSSILFLLNISPKKLYSSYRKRVTAITNLTKSQNILGFIPSGVNIKPETSGMSIIVDEISFKVLKKMVQEYSSLNQNVNWDKSIGIGYSTLRLPVGKLSLDAFNPLYIVELPSESNSDVFLLIPVGQLSDLNNWLTSQHQNSMTKSALILLVIGFFLQLFESFFH